MQRVSCWMLHEHQRAMISSISVASKPCCKTKILVSLCSGYADMFRNTIWRTLQNSQIEIVHHHLQRSYASAIRRVPWPFCKKGKNREYAHNICDQLFFLKSTSLSSVMSISHHSNSLGNGGGVFDTWSTGTEGSIGPTSEICSPLTVLKTLVSRFLSRMKKKIAMRARLTVLRNRLRAPEFVIGHRLFTACSRPE